jgi:Pyruvate/2-oxoacid:ferredoxin oxidoreductase gamma subunit
LLATARDLGPGGELSANVVALGAFVVLTGAVSEASLRRALRSRIKPALLELNERALAAGQALAAGAAVLARQPE